MTPTIFAVSSGAPPAAIAVIRVSGPAAAEVAAKVAGGAPEPRRAALRRLRDAGGETLDHALVLWFPGPASATGEDLLELHVHGGRAVIAAIERAVVTVPGTRAAEPGEFTRRALLNGRIDLAQATGLADLLEAETETQRRSALTLADGALSRDVHGWSARLADVRARLEASIDYDEEGDVARDDPWGETLAKLSVDLLRHVAGPTSERVREGWRVVVAGPRNAGKSSLFNSMLGREAAIVSPVAGTTRDRIEARVSRAGQVYTLVDTAGLAEWTDDPLEREGIVRSRAAVAVADLVLWVADEPPPEGLAATLWIRGRSDEPGRGGEGAWDLNVSARLPASVETLWSLVASRFAGRLATAEGYLLGERQHVALREAAADVDRAAKAVDPLIAAEHLRHAARVLAALLGADPLDAMLDALFARFCVGK